MSKAIIVPARMADKIDRLAIEAGNSEWLSPARKQEVTARIKELLKAKDAVLVAHYYVDDAIQELAVETGGHVADSLDMAYFGNEHPASTLVVAGVRFMGETAKILNPEKRVLMPDLKAECSLDLGCPADEFNAFCDEHPDRTVVVYANTSAEVKARADWVVTSGNALAIVNHLKAEGHKILWGPDRHLGRWIQKQTGADMVLWQGACIVHDEFRVQELKKLIAEHPEAEVLVHPESPEEVVELAHVVGSTKVLIEAARKSTAPTLIVATDYGIFHRMEEVVAGSKRLIAAPTGGRSATCNACAHCPWMAMNGLEKILHVLETGDNEIVVDEAVRQKARRSLQRMLDFSRQQALPVRGAGDA